MDGLSHQSSLNTDHAMNGNLTHSTVEHIQNFVFAVSAPSRKCSFEFRGIPIRDAVPNSFGVWRGTLQIAELGLLLITLRRVQISEHNQDSDSDLCTLSNAMVWFLL